MKFTEYDIKKMIEDLNRYAVMPGQTFIIFDTETTGRDKSLDRIVSVSAIKATYDPGTHKFTEVDRLDQFINPGIDIPKEASDVNGITNERVANCPHEMEASIKIHQVFGDHPYIIGQNIYGFDIDFMQEMAFRCGWRFEPVRKLDTLPIARQVLGKKPVCHKLGVIAEYLAVNMDDITLHESISDVIVTMHVLERLLMLYDGTVDIEAADAYYRSQPHPIADKIVAAKKAKKPKRVLGEYQPNIKGMSLWKDCRLYLNTTKRTEKVYFDLRTKEWNYTVTDIHDERMVNYLYIIETVLQMMNWSTYTNKPEIMALRPAIEKSYEVYQKRYGRVSQSS